MDFREKLKAKLQRMKNPQKREKRTWSPPKDGAPATVRLIANPYSPDPQGEPFVDLWFHYGIGGKFGILCPRHNTGDNCPACELVDTLKQSKDDADVKLRKDIQAKQRTYSVLVDRADPTLTPKYWGFGKGVHDELMEYAVDADYELFYDAKIGRDVVITSATSPGKLYPDTSLKMKPRVSPLAENPKDVEKILANIPPIGEVFRPMTPVQIKAKVNEFLSVNESDAESVSSESVRGGGAANGAAPDADSVDAAFDEALAE